MALSHTATELQKANSEIEEQKSTIALLIDGGNDDLRRQLEPEDVNGADVPMADDDDDDDDDDDSS